MSRQTWDRQQRLAWGKRIKEARASQSLTQFDLSDRITARTGERITPAAISSWETGDSAPSDWMRIHVARALGRHEAELFAYSVPVPVVTSETAA